MPFIEVADNLFQLIVVSAAAIWSGVISMKQKEQNFFLLFCFYVCFALGLLFWTLYLALMTYTPKIFYVSDLSWVVSFVFLLSLELVLVNPGEKRLSSYVPWIAPIIIAGFTLMYVILAGEYLMTIVWEIIMAVCGYLSLRGLIYARRQVGSENKLKYFHLSVLIVIVLEHILWTASCFFKESIPTNPYYYIDMVLTVSLFAMTPALKKAVGK